MFNTEIKLKKGTKINFSISKRIDRKFDGEVVTDTGKAVVWVKPENMESVCIHKRMIHKIKWSI